MLNLTEFFRLLDLPDADDPDEETKQRRAVETNMVKIDIEQARHQNRRPR